MAGSPLTNPLPPALPAYLRSAESFAAALQRHLFLHSTPKNTVTLHAQLLKSSLTPTKNALIKLLLLHLKLGSPVDAHRVLDAMPDPTPSAYNYVIDGFFKAGCARESLQVFRALNHSNVRPDAFALSMAVKLSMALAMPHIVREVHTCSVKLGEAADGSLLASLVDAYVKNGMVDRAARVYQSMPGVKNVICATALIVGFMNEKLFQDAEEIFQSIRDKDSVVFNAMIEGYSKEPVAAFNSLELYKAMRRGSSEPTVSTFVSLLGACCLLSVLDFGEQVHCEIIKGNLTGNIRTASALVDMYCKCGGVGEGRKVFDNMVERNVITWTAMIDGYAKNGLAEEALELFDEMRMRSDVRPNWLTFLTVLWACGHAGWISRGREVFQIMEEDYAVRPLMEHYACMVDLLGRNGSIREAYEFIKRMPVRPDSDVWAALLGAATLHGDVDVAQIAAKEVFELSRSGRPGAYMAASNSLAAAGKWDSVLQVRELMRSRGVSKEIGSSSIGIENP